jgi:hypothetical protein
MRSVRIVAFVGLLAVAASACSSTSVLTVVTASAAKTAAADSARVSEVVHVTPSATSKATPDITGDGIENFVLQQADLNATVAGQSVEVVVDSGVIYEKAPTLAGLTGKPWLKIDLNELGKLVGVSGLGNLLQSQSNDPSQGLKYLSGVSGPIVTVGHEKVRGVSTTHYRLTVDLSLAASRLPSGQQSTIQQIINVMGVHTMPVEVWIDGQGRVRRVHYTYDYGAAKFPGVPAGALPKSADITVEFYDFGVDATINVPTSDEVADFSQLVNQANAEAASAAPGSGLAALLITALPAGFQQAPDTAGGTGPTDLAKAARDDGHADATQVLTGDGFVMGYERAWTSGRSDIIEGLFLFKSPAGADSWRARDLIEDVNPPAGDRVSPFIPAGIPGGAGLTLTGKDGPAAVLVFAKGDFQVHLEAEGAAATPQTLTALAQQQYSRL